MATKNPLSPTKRSRKTWRRRVARSTLKPRGSKSDLEDAISCLGRLPTPKLESDGTFKLPYDFDFQGVDQIRNRSSAVDICTKIAQDHLRALEAKPTTLSPSRAIKRFEALRRTLLASAEIFSSMTDQERLLMHALNDVPQTSRSKRLVLLYNAMQPEDLPADGELGPGSLSETHQAVADYLGVLIPLLKKRYRQRRTGRHGLKLRRTAAGLFSAPPKWTLIDQAWRLFYRLGLEPSATVACPAHQFARHIHKWAINRTDSLDYYYKRYASARLKHNDCLAKLDVLAKQVPGLNWVQLEIDVQNDQVGKAPERVLRKARPLVAELSELEDLIHFGG